MLELEKSVLENVLLAFLSSSAILFQHDAFIYWRLIHSCQEIHYLNTLF